MGAGKVAEKSMYLTFPSSCSASIVSPLDQTEKHQLRELTTAGEDLVELLLPVIVKHLVGFINDHVLDAAQRQDVRTLHHVDQTARRGDENITALLQLINLVAHRSASIDDARSEHGTVAKLSGLVEDLNCEFSSRNHDDDQGLCPYGRDNACIKLERIRTRSSQLLGLAHQMVEDGDKIRSGLARTLTALASSGKRWQELLPVCAMAITS